ncbi:hypothetical protein [Desulfurobacterium sp.]
MNLYIGYPESFTDEESFKIKDVFLKEVNVSDKLIPVEVKKKLLGILNALKEKDYIFINDIHYDASDILEFALFRIKNRHLKRVVLPGYTYGKPTFIIREILKTIFEKRENDIEICHDFNLFSDETLVINIGYRETSLSIGGDFLSVVNIGEFNFIDTFGNYLFNRFLKDTGISNVSLRKEGKRGKYLDRFRACGARILLKRTTEVRIDEEKYCREVDDKEVKEALTILTGQANFGEFISEVADLSSAMIHALYAYEEEKKTKPPVKKIVIIGRIGNLYAETIERIFGFSPEIVSPQNLLKLSVFNKKSRMHFQRIKIKYDGRKSRYSVSQINIHNDFKRNIIILRDKFRKKEIDGVKIIEVLTETRLTPDELKTFTNELLTMGRILSFKDSKMLPYIDYIIAALSKIDIPEELFAEVEAYIKKLAFRWNLPLRTRMNVLYFCYKHREKLKQKNWFKILLPLTITWIRDKKLTEGERQFIRTATEIR